MVLDPSEGVAVYTDGSAYYKDKSGGWAFVAVDAFGGTYEEWDSAFNTTNNRMEMQAAISGLRYLASTFGKCDVLVLSDSEVMVLGVQNPKRARRKNVGYWHKLDAAIQRHAYVEFEHVRGHTGNRWNERCDVLAGQARKGEI